MKNNSSAFEKRMSITVFTVALTMIIGFTLVSLIGWYYMENMAGESLPEAVLIIELFTVTLLVLAVMTVFNFKYIKLLRKKLKGKTPEEMTAHVDLRIESMDKLREIIVVLDKNGTVIMENRAARDIAGKETLVGESFETVYPGTNITSYIANGEPLIACNRVVGDKIVVVEGMPVYNNGEYAYLIMGYDTTDISFLSEELAGKDNLIESMRVVNHDFMNKMHVLMGYLETGSYDEAKRFIYDIKSVPTKEISKITERVANPQLSALLVGKMIRGKEIGVRVHVVSVSECRELTEGIDVDEYTTIIGNLIENSLEELNASSQEEKNVDVRINTNKDWSFISVTDNGRGIQADDVDKVFEFGYSTKGVNRGIGIPIIHQIAGKHNGTVEVDSARDEGCTITVSMERRKNNS